MDLLFSAKRGVVFVVALLVAWRLFVVAVLRRGVEEDAIVRRLAVVVAALVVLPRKPRAAVVLMIDVRMIRFVCRDLQERYCEPVDVNDALVVF